VARVRGKLRCDGASSSSLRSRLRLPHTGSAVHGGGVRWLQVAVLAKTRVARSNSRHTGDRAPTARQNREGLERFYPKWLSNLPDHLFI